MKKAYWFILTILTFAAFYLPYLESSKAQNSSDKQYGGKLQEPPYDLDKSFTKLIATAQEKESVPVIVGFRFNLEPEGYLTNTQREKQRAKIKQNQDSLLQKLMLASQTEVVRFQTIPYVAIPANVKMLELLRKLPEVVFIREDEIQFPTLAESTQVVHATQAWSSGYSGQGQVIAILDTGIDKNHPFLNGKVISEACFSANAPKDSSVSSICPNGVTQSTAVNSGVNCIFSDGCKHGTHVAGIAAGYSPTGNRQGVARDAKLVSIQVFSRIDSAEICAANKESAPCIGTSTIDYQLGLERVLNLKQSGMNIAAVNLSLGGGRHETNCDNEFQDIKDAIKNLSTANVATVVASGNDGFTNAISRPACISYAISVGSTNDGSNQTILDAISSFSSGGASNSASILSLLAPGKWIESSILNGGYENLEGTSMAAPHVAGAWAILKQRVPNASVTHILSALRSTGQPVTDTRNNITKPRILIDAALQALSGNETTSEIKISALDGTGEARFGNSVAISGDTVVVGNPNTSGPSGNNLPGSVYVFIHNPDGTWSQQAKLFPSDSTAGNLFGTKVAISGNTLIVGAFPDRGAAYVFFRNGTTWTQQQKLTASDAAANDQFGYSVAISGDTAVVGAIRDDTGTITDHGSAYVFFRNGTTWTQQQKLTASDAAANDLFGIDVTISGDTIIVGSYFDDIGANTDQGSAYVFVRNGTIWAQQQKLTASDGTTGTAFGYSVAIEGNTAIIGKLTGIPLTGTVQGAAYIFVQNGTTWTEQQKLIGSDGVTNNAFGESVAISNNKVIIGAHRQSITATLQGASYIFVRNGTLWTQQQKLTASDAAEDDQFGSGVAISGDTMIAGAYRDDNPAFNQGSAYIFTNSFSPRNIPFNFDIDGIADIAVFRPSNGYWYVRNSSNGSLITIQFGVNGDLIAPADFDGDGKNDISVFRPSNGYWYRLNSSNNSFSGIQFGANGDLPVPGDFDGDGKADVAVYRPSAGSWYRLNSSNGQFVGNQFGIFEDKPIVGDFDGDGKNDLAVFRPSNGSWYRINSSNGQFIGTQFGIAEDKPVAADYDGDGKIDLAVFRPSNGYWYVSRSSDGSFIATLFGVSEDKASPADYDGDGRADYVVFRPSTGTWYLLRSTAGFTGVRFGVDGDVPASNAFVR